MSGSYNKGQFLFLEQINQGISAIFRMDHPVIKD